MPLVYATGSGGSTVLSLGNANRCLENELKKFGIDLDDEFKEIEQELDFQPISTELLSENGSLKLLKLFQENGLKMERMPKFINPKKCKKCGLCFKGCQFGAKWTAHDYLDEAIKTGTIAVYDTKVEKVLIHDGKAVGVVCYEKNGKEINYFANNIIISAGGLDTPVILQKSGFKS